MSLEYARSEQLKGLHKLHLQLRERQTGLGQMLQCFTNKSMKEVPPTFDFALMSPPMEKNDLQAR